MELFHKRKDFILFPILFLFSLVVNVHYATIPYDFTPKNTRYVIGHKFLFSLMFTGNNEKKLQSYAFVNVSVAPERDSKREAYVLIYSFTVLKKEGVKTGTLGKHHPFYKQISDIKTVKSGTNQTFSMVIRMVCRLSTNFIYVLVKDSKTSEILGKTTFNSYSIPSLGIDKQETVYYPGEKVKVDCEIIKCNSLDMDKNKLKYGQFILTSEQRHKVYIPPINSSAIVMSVHDNVIHTRYDLSRHFVMTCTPYFITCALGKKEWTHRRLLYPQINATFCRNAKMEFKVKWGESNYTNNMKYVADGATFTTSCTAFTPENTSIVSEGTPAKVISRVSIVEKVKNGNKFAVKQLTTFRNDDTYCYYPRKTFRCYVNDTEKASEITPIPFRPIECEPKFISFKPKKTGKNKLNLTCIIRVTRGERINRIGIVDNNEPVKVIKHLGNETNYGRNRNAIVINSNASFTSCDDLRGRNITCWYHYDGTLFTTDLDFNKLCEAKSYLWLLWLLLLLLIPLLCLCCCLLCACCRRKRKKKELKPKKEEEEEEEEEEEKKVKEVKKEKAVKEVKKKEKIEKKEKKVKKEKEVKEVKEKKKKKEKEKEEKKPAKVKPVKVKKVEARRMYRMFKKRRPFGWRELNDHFLWLSMMAQDEQRTRSLSPSCNDYAQFRLMKKRTRFGNRELMSYSQTLMQQGARTEEDLATLRDLESCYGNWSQLTVSPDQSNINDLDTEAKKEVHRQKILSEMYNEGAIGCYNQLETYEYIHNAQNPHVCVKRSESSDSSSDENSKTNNNGQSGRCRKGKHRQQHRYDDIA